MRYKIMLIVTAILIPVLFYVAVTVYASQAETELTVYQPADSSSMQPTRLPGRKTMNISVKTPVSALIREEDLAILFYREPGKARLTYNQFLAADTLAKRNGYNK